MFLNVHNLGLYTTAVSWSTGFLPLSSAYGSVVFPEVAAAVGARESFVTAMRRGLVVLFGGWIVFFALTPVLFLAIYGSAFSPAIPAVMILVAASLFLSANQMMAEGVKGLGRPLLVSISEVSGLVVTTIMLSLLISPFGIVGAALASLVAYMVTTAVLLTGLHRLTGCSWRDLLMTRPSEWRELGADLASAAGRLLPRRWRFRAPIREPLTGQPDAQVAE